MPDDTAEPRVEVFAKPSAMSGEIVFAQTAPGVVIALDGATGASLWRWTPRGHVASVAHGGERVYISVATDDRPTWVEVDPPSGWQPSRMAGAQPRSDAPLVRTQPFEVIALRASDGASVWRVTLYGDGSALPAHLLGDTLITSILSFERHAKEIIALDVATGALRWRREIGPLVDARGFSWRPFFWIEEGRVGVMTQADAHAANMRAYTLLDAATGEVMRRVEQAPMAVESSARVVSGGVVYQLDQTPVWPHTFVQAVRSSDGAQLWRVGCEGVGGLPPVPSQLLAAGGRLYLLSAPMRGAYATHVHALDMETGRVVWRWRSPVWLYWLFLARQPLQRVRDARRSGSWRPFWSDALHLRWRRPVRPAQSADMAAAPGRVYVANYLGAFAVRAEDGRQLWHALPLVALSHVSAAPPGSPSPASAAAPIPPATRAAL